MRERGHCCTEVAILVTGVGQLEDVLSWRCGHPQMRGVAAVAKDGDTEMPDLQLDALANLERHAGRYSAFSDEEDDDELHSLYLVRTPCALHGCWASQKLDVKSTGSIVGCHGKAAVLCFEIDSCAFVRLLR